MSISQRLQFHIYMTACPTHHSNRLMSRDGLDSVTQRGSHRQFTFGHRYFSPAEPRRAQPSVTKADGEEMRA